MHPLNLKILLDIQSHYNARIEKFIVVVARDEALELQQVADDAVFDK